MVKYYTYVKIICRNVLDTMSDSNEKVERKGAKPWITQEITNKMDE